MSNPHPIPPASQHPTDRLPEAEKETGYEHVPQRILDRAAGLWHAAVELERRAGGDMKYVKHDALATPLEDCLTIMLTRDGKPLIYEEDKERLYLHYPPSEDGTDIISDDLPALWITYLVPPPSKVGPLAKLRIMVTSDGITRVNEDELEQAESAQPQKFSIRGLVQKIAEIIRLEKSRGEATTIKAILNGRRLRDMVRNFQITPQHVKPTAHL